MDFSDGTSGEKPRNFMPPLIIFAGKGLYIPCVASTFTLLLPTLHAFFLILVANGLLYIIASNVCERQ